MMDTYHLRIKPFAYKNRNGSFSPAINVWEMGVFQYGAVFEIEFPDPRYALPRAKVFAEEKRQMIEHSVEHVFLKGLGK